MTDRAILALAFTAVLGAGVLALVVRAYLRVLEALGADGRVARLPGALGGVVTGPLQWTAPRGGGYAGLLVVTGRGGIERVSVWWSRAPTAPPRLLLKLFHEYDEPLRRAFGDGAATRIVVRPRSRLFGWLGPSALTVSALGDLADDLRVSSTAPPELVRAHLAPPAVRAHLQGALALGFDELTLYPGWGAELTARSPRAWVLDVEVVGAALAWLDRLGGW